MIISHKYKFIFLHSRRTGGNSFSLYFNKFAGADDLIVESWSEILSSGGRTNKEARSRLLRNLGNPQLLASTLRSAGSPAEALNYSNYISFHGEQKLGPNPAHTSAQMVSKMFPTEFNTYFKFAFFRNPYSFVLSDYAKRRHKLEQQGADFSSYLEAMGDPDLYAPSFKPTPRTNIDIYTFQKKNLAVDFLGEFDFLLRDLSQIFTRIGIPFESDGYPHAQKKGGGGGSSPIY